MADAGVGIGSILGFRRRLLKVRRLEAQAELESLNFWPAAVPVFYDPMLDALRPF